MLIFFSLIATFLILEGGLRIWLDQKQALPHFGISENLQMRFAFLNWRKLKKKFGTTTYPSSFDFPDPLLGWKVRANANVRHVKPNFYDISIQTNKFGLRGIYPATLTKPKGIVRIGVFGDSQTFGETVNNNETYISLLNRDLQNHNAEVLNFGVRGYGTDQMLLYFEQEAGNYDLDTIILAFAFFHIRRNTTSFLYYAKPYFTLSDSGKLWLSGIPVATPEQIKTEELIDKTWQLADNSVLLRWIWQRIRNLRERWLYSEAGDGWRLTKALITRFVQSATNAGINVIIMNIDESHPELEDALQTLTNQLGVKLLNLGPVFRENSSEGIKYKLTNDNHWNARGHRIVAQELHVYFCQHKVLLSCDN